jgi:hypothetical protein
MGKIVDYLKASSSTGMYLPMAYDPVNQKPSVTLLFPYVTFTLAVASVIALHFNEKLMNASIVSIVFWTVSTIFYLFRTLTKAKIDLDDKSIELEGDDDNDK